MPADLESIILDCLQKMPEDRPQSVRDLSRRLAACGDFGGWGPEQAKAWWDQHAELLAPGDGSSAPTELAATIAIDPAGRDSDVPAV